MKVDFIFLVTASSHDVLVEKMPKLGFWYYLQCHGEVNELKTSLPDFVIFSLFDYLFKYSSIASDTLNLAKLS